MLERKQQDKLLQHTHSHVMCEDFEKFFLWTKKKRERQEPLKLSNP